VISVREYHLDVIVLASMKASFIDNRSPNLAPTAAGQSRVCIG
jgi:hypothetical protein